MTSDGWNLFRKYLHVLRAPQAPRMVVSMFIGRLPNGMFPLGIVFVLHHSSGSYSVSGAALATLMLGTTCSAPFRGRMVDRWGQSRTLVPLVLIQTVAMTCFLLAASAGQGARVLIPLIAAVGATSSTLGGSMRQLWAALVRSDEELPTAYALQALLEDLISVTGPLIASLALAFASPVAILILAEVAALLGTTAFAAAAVSRSAAGRVTRSPNLLGALSTPGMRTLVLTLTAAGTVIGMLYIEVPAFTESTQNTTAGPLLAVMAGGSMISGLCYGARTWASGVDHRYVRLAGAFAAAVAPLALARTALQLGVLLSFVGIAYAPRMISAYLLLDDLAPHDSLTEAYTWLVSASAAGVALGSAIAGPLVQHAGVQRAFAVTELSAAAGYALAIARRHTLTPTADALCAQRFRYTP
ncbi:MFS transporter [Streptomyces sp. NPDC056656]|uniref:MFS transporter n=1 Tax=Streptomyces sp. NPDC056656 TaxID=3345895 RepID=UPI0036C7DFBE